MNRDVTGHQAMVEKKARRRAGFLSFEMHRSKGIESLLVIRLERVPRVSRVIGLFHLPRGQVGVNLRRRERLMAKQLLYAAKVRTVVEHVRGEAMPQSMRAYRRVETGCDEILVHLPPDAPRTHPAAVFIDKESLGVEIAVALGTPVLELKIMLDRLQRR